MKVRGKVLRAAALLIVASVYGSMRQQCTAGNSPRLKIPPVAALAASARAPPRPLSRCTAAITNPRSLSQHAAV